MKKIKLIAFYSGYLPGEKYGGPVVSLYNFTELLGDEIEIYIVCSDHDLKETRRYEQIHEGWNLVGKANVQYLSDQKFNKASFSRIIEEISPDMLYASSIFSASYILPLLSLAKKKNIPLLLAPRGELNNTALKIKKKKKMLYLLALQLGRRLIAIYFQATSIEEKSNIVDNLHVSSTQVFLLPNIPAIPMHKTEISKKTDEIRMCFVGRIVENKNLLIALKAVCASKTHVIFDIFGPIEDEEYWNKCRRIINVVPSNVEIRYRGVLQPLKIRNIYPSYDFLISPTEFENYGQAIVEAMLHDVPVIISKGTTPWDDIQDSNCGFVIPLEKIEQFSEAINALGKMTLDEYQELIEKLREYCVKKFDFVQIEKQYLNVFTQIINN